MNRSNWLATGTARRLLALLLGALLLGGCFGTALAEQGTGGQDMPAPAGSATAAPAPTATAAPAPKATATATPTATATATATATPAPATPTATPPTIHVVVTTPAPSGGEPTQDPGGEDGGDEPAPAPDPGGERVELSRWLGGRQENGEVPALAGERGGTLTITLPLVARYDLSDVEIEPVYSTSLDSFPFVLPTMSLMVKKAEDKNGGGTGDLKAGECWQVVYENLTFSRDVTKGVKQVDFHVRYTYQGVRAEETISVFVNVTKGASLGGGGGTSFRSQPKLIVEQYSLGSERLYAGEPFELTLVLRNTSSDEAIRNIQIHMKEETGVVLPAENGSNTLYIKEIAKEDAATVTVTLQSAPDAEAKAYALGLSFSYDGVSSKQAYTAEESITLPVQQRIRIKCDDPVVYDEPWTGQLVAVGVSLYNMGKSTVYNCMVGVEGEGLSMPETYFGGNIASGGIMRAEFDMQTDVPGDIEGAVVITYEDVYGEQLEERLPLTLFVNEQLPVEPLPGPDGTADGGMAAGEISAVDSGYPAMGGMGGMDGMDGAAGGGIAWYWWALAIAAVAAGVIVLGVRRRRARKKELEAL